MVAVARVLAARGGGAGVLGVAWWIVVPLTLAGLSVSSSPKDMELWPRAETVGAQAEWWKTVALSTFNSLGGSGGGICAWKPRALAVVVN